MLKQMLATHLFSGNPFSLLESVQNKYYITEVLQREIILSAVLAKNTKEHSNKEYQQ